MNARPFLRTQIFFYLLALVISMPSMAKALTLTPIQGSAGIFKIADTTQSFTRLTPMGHGHFLWANVSEEVSKKFSIPQGQYFFEKGKLTSMGYIPSSGATFVQNISLTAQDTVLSVTKWQKNVDSTLYYSFPDLTLITQEQAQKQVQEQVQKENTSKAQRTAIAHSSKSYLCIETKTHAMKPGLYFYEQGQAQYEAFLPSDTLQCDSLRVDFFEKILALTHQRTLQDAVQWYSYPQMTLLGEAQALSPVGAMQHLEFLMAGPQAALSTAINFKDTLERHCSYDPCGPISVYYTPLREGEKQDSTPLFAATELCDYYLIGQKGNTVYAEERCVPTVESWKQTPTFTLQGREVFKKLTQ